MSAGRASGSLLRGLAALAGAAALHGGLVVGLYRARPPAPPAQESLTVSVINLPPKEVPPPPPAPKAVPLRRPPRVPTVATLRAKAPPPPVNAPPPPTHEAKQLTPQPVVLPGISFESTSSSGSMSVAVGNTLYGDPGRKGRDPNSVHGYKARRYVTYAGVSEGVSMHCDEGALHDRYYPPDEKHAGEEAVVRLRVLIDSDGSLVKAEVVDAPSKAFGQAAARAAREVCSFTAAKVQGEAVATMAPVAISFRLN